MVAVATSTWVWCCPGKCEQTLLSRAEAVDVFDGVDLGPSPATDATPSSMRRWTKHPLMSWRRTETPPVGYIRSNTPVATDAWGWWPLWRST
jgi:hypothetical protein